MLEMIMQFFVLTLVVGFAVVAIVGNFLRHEQQVRREVPNRPSRDSKLDDFRPRVLALSAVRSENSSRAA